MTTKTTLELRRGDRVRLPFNDPDGTPAVRTVDRIIPLDYHGIVGNRPIYAVWYQRHDADGGCPTGNSAADNSTWTLDTNQEES